VEATAQTEEAQGQLAEDLAQLGRELPPSYRPSPSALYDFLTGLSYWLATGSTEAPESAAPEAQVESPEQQRIKQLEAELQSAQNAVPAADRGPSPVAPVPPQPSEPAAGEGQSATEPPSAPTG
jgi:hypothetical protein